MNIEHAPLPAGYEFLKGCSVVPVIVIDQIDQAVPLCRALVAGGLTNLEITLRTDCALEAIAKVRSEVEGAIVGAGTVTNSRQLDDALAAGARFIVTPGTTETLLDRCRQQGIALLPGAVTASEVMTALEYGFELLKFFPAGTSGGPAAIKALGGPFAQVRFMPTGGVSPANLQDYLSLPNVIAAGGSWMLPSQLIQQQDWQAITKQATQAVQAAAQRN